LRRAARMAEGEETRSGNQFDLAASNERITDVRFLKPPSRFKSLRRYAPRNKTKLRRAIKRTSERASNESLGFYSGSRAIVKSGGVIPK